MGFRNCVFRFQNRAVNFTDADGILYFGRLLMSHLAYLSNRSFVFEDYALSRMRVSFSIRDFFLRPSRIPLNALISGPTAGGPMPAPRAVNVEYWDFVCPRSVITRLSPADAPKIRDGSALVDWWTAKLFNTPARCVEIVNRPPVLNQFLLGSNRILSLWPSLTASPILADFTWSPLVMAGVARNLPYLTRAAPSFVPGTIEGLVAIHLPRGDYVQQCHQFLRWGKPYMGFNQFDDLPDRFDPPKFGSMKVLGGRENYYMQHCCPKIDDVVEKLRDVRRGNARLQRVYVLTDDWSSWWMGSLRKALAKDGWLDVRSSQNLQLNGEQKYMKATIDMAIAERADVFVGNGVSVLVFIVASAADGHLQFSSVSSNVVMLRTSKNMDPQTSRFW